VTTDHADTPDFRAERMRLPPESFALAPEVEEPASDLIAADTWRGLVWLTDDVSLRTCDHHGTALHRAYTVWSDWISVVLDVQGLAPDPATDPVGVAAIGSAEEFQASIHLALTGFYRQAIGTLRAVLESLLAALDFSIRDDPSAVSHWLEGAYEGMFWTSRVRRRLSKLEPFSSFTSDEWSLFADSGWFAWLYDLLCAFVHGRPAHTTVDGNRIETTNGGLWQSNGPIYVTGVFDMWSRISSTRCSSARSWSALRARRSPRSRHPPASAWKPSSCSDGLAPSPGGATARGGDRRIPDAIGTAC
jgi:hypothetical protein